MTYFIYLGKNYKAVKEHFACNGCAFHYNATDEQCKQSKLITDCFKGFIWEEVTELTKETK